MKPTLRWPIDLTHEKCGSDEHVYITEASVERTGFLIFKATCWRCEDDFVLKFSMLELCAEAANSDREVFANLPELPGTYTAYAAPN